jgi:hypothetical protein
MLICRSPVPLDDDQIAQAAQMNRVYVNAICRQLAQDSLIIRDKGSRGKIVNAAADQCQPVHGKDMPRIPPHVPRRPGRSRQRSAERLADRVGSLIAGFGDYVAAFEARQAFPGPSVYFHLRAIERRREHHTAESLLDDRLFLEYVYAVLPAWGMHGMGPQAAKGRRLRPDHRRSEGGRPGAGAAVAATHHRAGAA